METIIKFNAFNCISCEQFALKEKNLKNKNVRMCDMTMIQNTMGYSQFIV